MKPGDLVVSNKDNPKELLPGRLLIVVNEPPEAHLPVRVKSASEPWREVDLYFTQFREAHFGDDIWDTICKMFGIGAYKNEIM